MRLNQHESVRKRRRRRAAMGALGLSAVALVVYAENYAVNCYGCDVTDQTVAQEVVDALNLETGDYFTIKDPGAGKAGGWVVA